MASNNPFCGRTDGVRFGPNDYKIKDYAKCNIVQKVNHLDKSDDTVFDVVTEINITDIVSLDDYINSFRDDVGVINILKKVSRTGDLSLLKQCDPGYVDMTNMPEDFIQAKAMYDQAIASYNMLPVEIRGNMPFEEFIKLSADDLNARVESYVSSLNPAKPADKIPTDTPPAEGDK